MTARHHRTVQTLIEALPYIRRFQGATMVIKYGGAAMTSGQLAEQFAKDVILLKLVGMRPIIVHGGGPEISRQMGKLGMEPVFVDGQRVTDADTLEVAYGDVEVVRDGEPVALGAAACDALAALMAKPEIDLHLALHRGAGTSTLFFSDLSHEYVSVNSESTT